jgi:predicted nucleotidyltransferase
MLTLSMQNIFEKALQKVVHALESEQIDYMIVGGFAVSYHNRARTTNDIDLVLQIYPAHVKSILKHFPDWKGFETSFMDSVKHGMLFNITDFETGIRYDFMAYQDSDYNWTAFQRRKLVDFWGVKCFVCSKEDLVILKLQWYNISKSDKQLEDLKFLLLDESLDIDYIKSWSSKLNLKTHGLLG